MMDILIAGAGIGGLTAALALRRQGHRVIVCTYPKNLSFRIAYLTSPCI